jgi:branched-chain amino acid transport system ATP-binding protein
MIGPNGAGKTTVFNCLTGFYKPTGGSILLDGEPIQGLPGTRSPARRGAHLPERAVVQGHDAVENLLIAQHRHLNTNFRRPVQDPGVPQASARPWNTPPTGWKGQPQEFANRPAGTLAYGQQRRLEIARCMMTRPRILMLDEPAAGLNPKETEDLKALISVLREEHNVTVLLIEHDMKLVMSISDHIVVINQGTPWPTARRSRSATILK